MILHNINTVVDIHMYAIKVYTIHKYLGWYNKNEQIGILMHLNEAHTFHLTITLLSTLFYP